MGKTTRVLLAIGVIIVLSYPGIAWVTGMVVETRLQHSEQQALDKLPYLTVVKREYHRGMYRSAVVTTYGLRGTALQAMKLGAALPSSITITIASNIQHGPLPGLHAPALAVIDSTVVLPPALQQQLSGVIGSKPFLQFHSTLGLFGGATSDVTSPAFSLRLADGSNVVWGGLTGTLGTTRDQAHLSARLSAPHLLVQGAQGGVFELTAAEYSAAEDKALEGLYVGTGTFTIERVNGNGPRPGTDFSLQRVSLTSTSKANGEFFDYRVDVASDTAKVAAVQLTNIMYSESFEHIHGPSLLAFANALRAAQLQAGGNQTQLQAGMLAAFRQHGIDLVLHDPVINIRQLTFTMPEGSFLLSARLTAPGLAAADLQQLPAAIMALRSHAHVTADLRVDNGLLQRFLAMSGSNPKVAAQLTSFEQQGYLTAGATAVTTHLELAGGRITLNGHPFPPAAPVN